MLTKPALACDQAFIFRPINSIKNIIWFISVGTGIKTLYRTYPLQSKTDVIALPIPLLKI